MFCSLLFCTLRFHQSFDSITLPMQRHTLLQWYFGDHTYQKLSFHLNGNLTLHLLLAYGVVFHRPDNAQFKAGILLLPKNWVVRTLVGIFNIESLRLLKLPLRRPSLNIHGLNIICVERTYLSTSTSRSCQSYIFIDFVSDQPYCGRDVVVRTAEYADGG